MNEIITVTGKGKINLPPDNICVNLSFEIIRDTYEETMEASKKALDMLRDVLKQEGFDRKDIKTKQIMVDVEFDSYKDHDLWKKKFAGYKRQHDLKIEFSTDGKKLSRILILLAICPICLNFSIQYTIKDLEQAKNQLLEKAVLDSRNKAEILTKASGVRLGKVNSINYSWEEIMVFSEPVKYSRESICEQAIFCTENNLDIEPEDLELTDIVTVVWEILYPERGTK